MAEANKTEKRVKLFIPAARGKEEQTLTVGVNGKIYRIPKGTEQELPAAVAAEIKRSWAAEAAFEKTRRKKLDEVAKAGEALK